MKLLLATIKSDNKQTELALKYLYSVLFDSPLDVHVKTFGRNELYSDIFEDIANAQYDIVYFHADSFNIRQLCRVADMVKKAIPNIAIIFGGMEVSFETRSFVKQNDFVDYVITVHEDPVFTVDVIHGLVVLVQVPVDDQVCGDFPGAGFQVVPGFGLFI